MSFGSAGGPTTRATGLCFVSAAQIVPAVRRPLLFRGLEEDRAMVKNAVPGLRNRRRSRKARSMIQGDVGMFGIHGICGLGSGGRGAVAPHSPENN